MANAVGAQAGATERDGEESPAAGESSEQEAAAARAARLSYEAEEMETPGIGPPPSVEVTPPRRFRRLRRPHASEPAAAATDGAAPSAPAGSPGPPVDPIALQPPAPGAAPRAAPTTAPAAAPAAEAAAQQGHGRAQRQSEAQSAGRTPSPRQTAVSGPHHRPPYQPPQPVLYELPGCMQRVPPAAGVQPRPTTAPAGTHAGPQLAHVGSPAAHAGQPAARQPPAATRAAAVVPVASPAAPPASRPTALPARPGSQLRPLPPALRRGSAAAPPAHRPATAAATPPARRYLRHLPPGRPAASPHPAGSAAGTTDAAQHPIPSAAREPPNRGSSLLPNGSAAARSPVPRGHRHHPAPPAGNRPPMGTVPAAAVHATAEDPTGNAALQRAAVEADLAVRMERKRQLQRELQQLEAASSGEDTDEAPPAAAPAATRKRRREPSGTPPLANGSPSDGAPAATEAAAAEVEARQHKRQRRRLASAQAAAAPAAAEDLHGVTEVLAEQVGAPGEAAAGAVARAAQQPPRSSRASQLPVAGAAAPATTPGSAGCSGAAAVDGSAASGRRVDSPHTVYHRRIDRFEQNQADMERRQHRAELRRQGRPQADLLARHSAATQRLALLKLLEEQGAARRGARRPPPRSPAAPAAAPPAAPAAALAAVPHPATTPASAPAGAVRARSAATFHSSLPHLGPCQATWSSSWTNGLAICMFEFKHRAEPILVHKQLFNVRSSPCQNVPCARLQACCG